MAFRAKYEGRCVTCGSKIYEGDLISGVSRAYSHAACAAAAAEVAPAPAADLDESPQLREYREFLARNEGRYHFA